MSGPKVVRVVTREELVATGETLLRRLDAAVASWQQTCSETGAATTEVQQTNARRDQLESALRQGKFTEFGTKAVAEIEFLDVDAARRRQSAAQALARDRARLVRGREIAASFLRASAETPQKLRAELERAAAGKLTVTELDAVLSDATRSFHTTEALGLSDSQRALASRLAASERGQTLADWKSGQLRAEPRLQTLWEHVVELELLGEASAAATLQVQLRQAQSVEVESDRQLRLDSLQIAFRRAKETGVKRSGLLKEAKLLSAELGSFGGETPRAIGQLHQLVATTEIAALEEAVSRAREELVAMQHARAAAARRCAVLEGLSKLGYSVNEGLSTAVPSSGKVVLRSPDSADYGVEITGMGALERLQVRSVAFSASRDPSQDIPAETRWCGDFGKLQTALKSQGCEVVVEKAMGIGAVALKVLDLPAEDERRRANRAASARKGAT